MIPYGRQDINEEDIAAVCAVLRSEFLTQGPAIERFERKVADYCGARYAVAVSSATAALHLACLALDVGPHDRVWTSPNTFVASANCARYCGADADFVDIDPVTWNMSTTCLGERLDAAEREGMLPKALIPVHFAGQSCDMEVIADLAKERGIAIIEDASHAIGARFAGVPVGACRHSECAVFSFHPVKIVTTGEGGIVVTNREELAERMRRLRSHGITRDRNLMTETNPGPWHYEQLELGYNYRMTDLQAALGTSQMDRVEGFVARRRELSDCYSALLADLPLRLPVEDARSASSWHLYVVRLQLDAIRSSHREVFEALRAAGIGVNLHYMPVHLQPYYRALGFTCGYCPEAEQYHREAISLPLYPGLTEVDQNYVAATLRRLIA